jgi:hypothetical protein
MWARSGIAALLLVAWGCAPVPAPSTTPVPPAATTPSTTTVLTPQSAGIDSTPSSDAIEVLKSIPEPIAPEDQVPPPEHVTPGADSSATAPDSTSGMSSSTAADSTAAGAPVPEPTLPLGQRPPSDSTSASSPPASPPPPITTPPPAAPTHATPDTCWRVQVGAPPERAKAEQTRKAAESLLVTPMVVERERGRYKVRTRECLDRDAAEALKTRARGSGFSGAFRFAVPKP